MQLTLLIQQANECYASLNATAQQVRAALPYVMPDAQGRWFLQDAQGRKAMMWAVQDQNGTVWSIAGDSELVAEIFTPRRSRAAQLVTKLLSFFQK